jgi:hypothetical protein
MRERDLPGADRFRTEPPKTRPDLAAAYAAGGEPVDPAHAACLAKAVPTASGGVRHFVRRQAGGHGFFSPAEHEARELAGRHPVTGRDRWEWAAVGEDSFDLYVKFLRTGNAAHLRNAERVQN